MRERILISNKNCGIIGRITKPRRSDNSPGPANSRRESAMKTISLTRGYVAIVDDEDYDWLSQWKWCVHTTKARKPYAIRRGILGDPQAPSRTGLVQMHRELLGLSFGDGLLADHVSGATLDNRRRNLRVVNKAQNAMNRAVPANSTTGVSGVCWNKRDRKYQAQIKIKGKVRHLGSFLSLEEAAAARRQAEGELFGEYGYAASQAQSAPRAEIGERS